MLGRGSSRPLACQLQPTGFDTTEPSNRSRGLLHAATGVYVAAAHAVRHLAVPENGYMAINLPLTASRTGSLSTRSTHPWTVHLLNDLIDAIGGDVRVINPYLGMTKGEVVGRARDHQATPQFLARTISCGDHPANRSDPGAHCGYCFPCLVRRSAMLAALGSDPTGYTCSLAGASRHQGRGRHSERFGTICVGKSRSRMSSATCRFPTLPPHSRPSPCWSAVGESSPRSWLPLLPGEPGLSLLPAPTPRPEQPDKNTRARSRR
jgi:hypothetical protein